MNLDHLFNFAQRRLHLKERLPENFKFFLLKCEQAWEQYGDKKQIEFHFLVAAPDADHAKAWVMYDFLTNYDDSLKTYQDMLDQLSQFKIGQGHSLYGYFPEYTQLGPNHFRHIKSCVEITPYEADTIQKYGLFKESNYIL